MTFVNVVPLLNKTWNGMKTTKAEGFPKHTKLSSPLFSAWIRSKLHNFSDLAVGTGRKSVVCVYVFLKNDKNIVGLFFMQISVPNSWIHSCGSA